MQAGPDDIKLPTTIYEALCDHIVHRKYANFNENHCINSLGLNLNKTARWCALVDKPCTTTNDTLCQLLGGREVLGNNASHVFPMASGPRTCSVHILPNLYVHYSSNGRHTRSGTTPGARSTGYFKASHPVLALYRTKRTCKHLHTLHRMFEVIVKPTIHRTEKQNGS